jgi:cytochrome b561
MPTEQLHYGRTAKVFHWAIAALIAIQLPLGWLMPDIHRGETPGTAMSLHVSIGMTILVLIVLRFLWRLTHPVAPETNPPGWQRMSSELVHWLLYVVVLLTTLSGWFAESVRGWTIYLYGIVPLPRLDVFLAAVAPQ